MKNVATFVIMCFISAILWVSTPLVMNRKADSRLAVVGTADDLAWRDVASKNGATFIEANSDLAKNLLVAADASPTITKGKPILIIDSEKTGGGELNFESAPKKIEEILLEKSRKAPIFILPIVGLLSTVVVGFVLRGPISWLWLSGGLLGYGGACIWKLTALCRLCGEGGSVDATIVSFGLLTSFSLAGLLANAKHETSARNATGLLLCGTAIFQAVSWSIQPHTDCPACIGIALLSGAMAASMYLIRPAENLPSLVQLCTGPIAVSISIAALLILNQNQESSTNSLTGSVVNVTDSPSPKNHKPMKYRAGQILVYTSETCHACTELKTWLANKAVTHVTYINVATIADRDQLPNRVPTTVAVSSTGTVLAEVSGWSDDVLWQKAYLQFISKHKNVQGNVIQ